LDTNNLGVLSGALVIKTGIVSVVPGSTSMGAEVAISNENPTLSPDSSINDFIGNSNKPL